METKKAKQKTTKLIQPFPKAVRSDKQNETSKQLNPSGHSLPVTSDITWKTQVSSFFSSALFLFLPSVYSRSVRGFGTYGDIWSENYNLLLALGF